MLTFYLWASTLFLGFLGLIWRADSWANLTIRSILLALTISGLFLLLREHGYAVKVP
jgi:hypothetical protein